MILILGNILTHVILILGNIYWLLGKHTENTLCGQGNVISELICARFNNKVQGIEPKLLGVSINSSHPPHPNFSEIHVSFCENQNGDRRSVFYIFRYL